MVNLAPVDFSEFADAVGTTAEVGSRRDWLRTAACGVVGLGAMMASPRSGAATPAAGGREVLARIGFQKSASLLTLQKSQGTLERRLASLGTRVQWVEFPAGPQLLEGLNVGAIDLGFVGEAPPIFAQAAGASFVYVGYDPAAPEAEAIVVPQASPVRRVADLRGRKVALNKGSNVHFLLLRLLEQAGVSYSEIQPVFLPPADARAAFERGAVDAWVIWDPFLAERGFAERHPQVLSALFDETQQQARWVKTHLDEAARLVAPLQGLDVAVVRESLHRYQFGARPVSAEIVAEQQRVADAFASLKLIPKPIRVADALPRGAAARQ